MRIDSAAHHIFSISGRTFSMQYLNKIELFAYIKIHSELFNRDANSNPFTSSAWFTNFVEQIAEDDWTFIVNESDNAPKSVMLLYSKPDTPGRLEPVSNYYTSVYTPLISDAITAENRSRAIFSLVSALTLARPRKAVVNLSPLDKDASDTIALRHSFLKHFWYVREYFCFGNWYLPCEGLSFEEYMASRDSQLYHTWSRKLKQFNNKSTQGASLQIITEPKDTVMAMDAYEVVYAKSWKKSEPYANFIRKWAYICAENGWLRLGLAWDGDVPIASQIWFIFNRKAYIFKLAYDGDYSKWSVGTLLSAHMFRQALDEDNVVEIDYLTGDDAYKKFWMSKRRERIGLIACNPRVPRGFAIAMHEFAGALRQRWEPRPT